MLHIEICAAYDETKHMQISQAPISFLPPYLKKKKNMPTVKEEETIS